MLVFISKISNSNIELVDLGHFLPCLSFLAKNIENVSVLEVMTSMDFQTLPYLYVTISFLLEICFWGPTHPTFSDDVTNFTLFFLKASLTPVNCFSYIKESLDY